MHWWCYIGYKELFRAVYGRPFTESENEKFKKLNREQTNDWVLEHVGKTLGQFVAIDQRAENGYVAFTSLPYFMKGIADGEIPVPDDGLITENRLASGISHGIKVVKVKNEYKLISWWNNGGNDNGITAITMNEKKDLYNYIIHSPKLQFDLIFNWDERKWIPAQNAPASFLPIRALN